MLIHAPNLTKSRSITAAAHDNLISKLLLLKNKNSTAEKPKDATTAGDEVSRKAGGRRHENIRRYLKKQTYSNP